MVSESSGKVKCGECDCVAGGAVTATFTAIVDTYLKPLWVDHDERLLRLENSLDIFEFQQPDRVRLAELERKLRDAQVGTIVPLHTLRGFQNLKVPLGVRALVPIGGWDVSGQNEGDAFYVYPDGESERVKLSIEFPEHPKGG